MSFTTHAAGAFTALALAATPVAAQTLLIAAPGERPVSAVPAAPGPSQRFAQLVPQNVTIEAEDAATLPAGSDPKPRSLVPQNPVISDPTAQTAEPPKAAAPAQASPPSTKTRRAAKKRKYKGKQAKGASPGSWELLFQGPGKK